jgi:hypothetical protein
MRADEGCWLVANVDQLNVRHDLCYAFSDFYEHWHGRITETFQGNDQVVDGMDVHRAPPPCSTVLGRHRRTYAR